MKLYNQKKNRNNIKNNFMTIKQSMNNYTLIIKVY